MPADVLACVLTAVVQLGGSSGIAARHGHPISVAGYLLLAAGPAALLVRRRFPVGVLWVTVAAAVGYVAIQPAGLPYFALLVAFVAAVLTGHR